MIVARKAGRAACHTYESIGRDGYKRPTRRIFRVTFSPLGAYVINIILGVRASAKTVRNIQFRPLFLQDRAPHPGIIIAIRTYVFVSRPQSKLHLPLLLLPRAVVPSSRREN